MGEEDVLDPRRALPRVDACLRAALTLRGEVPEGLLVTAVREALADWRGRLAASDETSASIPTVEEIAREAWQRAVRAYEPRLMRAINATGIILHTNLGRAVLAPSAREQVAQTFGYCTLEMDRDSGQRGERLDIVRDLLRTLTGAEDAAVVNNNAAATLILLRALAKGREVICARGQLVEIGGSFRMPDVMAEAGVKLVEVGTTNRVHLRDYENAIGPDTGAIVKVHPSNYRVVGFTKEVPIAELCELGRRRDTPVMDDLGAGALVDLSAHGLPPEPLVAESIAAGCAGVCMSGDKLIGAYQAGIIVGTRAVIAAVHRDPLYRALRCGKLALAALEATLKLFLEPATLHEHLPSLAMASKTPESLAAAATQLAQQCREAWPALHVETLSGHSQMGSGSLPGEELPTTLVALSHETLGAAALAARLRQSTPPVFARVTDDRVCLDPRTLLADDLALLLAALRQWAAS